jgi:hypothetical protein
MGEWYYSGSLRDGFVGCGLDSSGSGWNPVALKTVLKSSSIKCGKFLDQLNN